MKVSNRARGETVGSKVTKNTQGNVECVPESNLELYKSSRVEFSNKENLHPGAQLGILGYNDDMEMENACRLGDDVNLSASTSPGEKKEFPTPILADDR